MAGCWAANTTVSSDLAPPLASPCPAVTIQFTRTNASRQQYTDKKLTKEGDISVLCVNAYLRAYVCVWEGGGGDAERTSHS